MKIGCAFVFVCILHQYQLSALYKAKDIMEFQPPMLYIMKAWWCYDSSVAV